MSTKILNLQDFTSYVKCGEVLKSPLPNYQHPFILKCYQCDKINFMLESFIIHIQEHCSEYLSLQDNTKAVSENELEQEPIENPLVKIEVINMEIDDPLVGIKDEIEEPAKIVEVGLDSTLIEDSDNQEEDKTWNSDEEDDNESNTEDGETDEDVVRKPTKKVRKSSISSTTEDFMGSKQNMKILIELYRNQPNLWNKELPMYRFRDKRQGFLEEICTDLNAKLNTKYNWKEILDIIRFIFKKHREDFKRLRGYEEDEGRNLKDTKYKCSWFYDDLYFLRPKTVIELHKLDSNLSNLSTEQVIQILQIYRDHPQLWNCNLIEYVCSNKRQETLAEMIKSLETNMNIKTDEKSLEEYIRSIHSYFSKEKRLRKKISTKKCKPNEEYYEHMTFLYDHEGPFNCTDCKRVFTKPLGFRVHRSSHDDSTPLICSMCNKEFKSIPTYTVHAKRHFGDLDYVCDICNRKFVAYADLRVHTLTHSGDRPYCCEKCGASYRHIQCFKRHQRRHEKRYTHQCTICSKGYYSKDRYDDHMNSHMNIRSYICPLCGRGFITSRALKTHSVTHEEARNHACKLCGKTFKLKIGVLQHMRTHGTRAELEVNSNIE